MNVNLRAQATAVLHQNVSAEAQARLLAPRLRVQNALRVGAAGVGLIAPLLAAEIDRRIARILVPGLADLPVVTAILANEALHARPRFDQRSVSGEVLVAHPALLTRQIVNLGE